MLCPTYKQLLEIVGYWQAINFECSPKILHEETKLVIQHFKKNPQKNVSDLIKSLKPKLSKRSLKNLNLIKSRLLYGVGNAVREEEELFFPIKKLK